MTRILYIISIICLAILGYGQTTNKVNEKRFSPTHLQSDLHILHSSLKDVHPSLYAFISEDSLNNIVNTTANNITDSLSELEFHVLIRQVIRNIRCGHTTARPSKEWYTEQANDSKILPIDVFLIKDKIYIKQVYDKDSTLIPRLEIVSIDGSSIKEITKEMRSIQQIDGYQTSFEDKSIQKLFRTYYLFLYGRNDHYSIEHLDQLGNINQIIVKGGVSKPKLETNQKNPQYSTSGSRYYISNESESLAVLDIDNFPSKGYKKYYKSVFKALKNRGINNLVIDLRGNGGGYFPNGNMLLRYLVDEKFYMDFSRPKNKVHKQLYLKMGITSKITRNMFKLMPDTEKSDPNRNYAIRYKPKKKNAYRGNLYLLVDGGTFSMGSLVASKLKYYTNCTIIGEETGGGEMGSNAILMYNLTLPETNIRVNIPYYEIDHKVTLDKTGRGVIPDISVNYDIEDLVNKRDKDMEAVKKMINQE